MASSPPGIDEQDGALLAVIADEDTITGFLLAGVGNVDLRKRSNFLVVDAKTTAKQVEQAFREFTSREDVAIVLISQPIANMIRDVVASHSRVRSSRGKEEETVLGPFFPPPRDSLPATRKTNEQKRGGPQAHAPSSKEKHTHTHKHTKNRPSRRSWRSLPKTAPTIRCRTRCSSASRCCWARSRGVVFSFTAALAIFFRFSPSFVQQ